MARLDSTRRATWASRPTVWPGTVSDDTFARLQALAHCLSDSAHEAMWSTGDLHRTEAVFGLLHRLSQPEVNALAGPALTLTDAGVPFSCVLLTPEAPCATEGSVFASFDRAFGDYGWALRLRRPLPDEVDVAPILQSLRLWFTARSMVADTPLTVTYDDDALSLEFTLLEGLSGGRLVTLGPRTRPPVRSLEAALKQTDGAPVVVVRAAQAFGRQGLLSALYGPAQSTETCSGASPTFRSTVGRAGWFADHPEVGEVWWLDPALPPDPFGRMRRFINPWGPTNSVVPQCDGTVHAQATNEKRATLEWVGGGR
ncbi:MAG: hypothetical protein AAGA48_12890 [Myxococcota bacterium]